MRTLLVLAAVVVLTVACIQVRSRSHTTQSFPTSVVAPSVCEANGTIRSVKTDSNNPSAYIVQCASGFVMTVAR